MYDILRSDERVLETPMTHALESAHVTAIEQVYYNIGQAKQLLSDMIDTAISKSKAASKEIKSNIEATGSIIQLIQIQFPISLKCYIKNNKMLKLYIR